FLIFIYHSDIQIQISTCRNILNRGFEHTDKRFMDMNKRFTMMFSLISRVLSYLKVTGLKTALLINFNEKTLSSSIKRISM
ncbi:MAG: hypothetical protein KAU17_08750, partial [Spirochaetales bacterium]|nr:hypothetical protein [Spirochaetales bacterium]